ncbi:MAG TPA: hypothetical protein PKN33_07160 [Phycisphaerae bacterium]|nr:hypothetical protein [Phycisphaerae bacterium]
MNPDHVPIEDQIANLRDCGIEPVSRFAIEYVVCEFGREELEASPYEHLMSGLGGEYEDSQGDWQPTSTGIWHVDTECIYDACDYVKVVNRLALLTRRDLILENVEAHFENDAWVQFDIDGAKYHWELEVDGDWIDTSIFERFAVLLAQNQSERRYLVSESSGQDFLLICPTDEEFDLLASLTPVRFGPILPLN